jgi:hypothetical protein
MELSTMEQSLWSRRKNIVKRILDHMYAGTAKIDFMNDTKGIADTSVRLLV